MLELASKDILNYTLTICILFVSIFLCWIMYYIISMMKKANDSLKLMHTIMNSINGIIENTKSKFKNSIAGLEIVGTLAKKIFDQINTKKQNKKTKTKK